MSINENLLTENTCYVCLEECNTKSKCKCNSFIHSKCLKELKKEWCEDKCACCMEEIEETIFEKFMKKLIFFCPYFSYFLAIILCIPLLIGYLYFTISGTTDKDFLNYTQYFTSMWILGLLIELFTYVLVKCCTRNYDRI